MDSFGWMGGKKLLRKEIAKYIPKDINFYVEVFGGMGWVLLYKSKYARNEVYNDLDNRLINMFMQLKWHPEAVIGEMDNMLNSRYLFDHIKHNKGITEIQKAARFLFLLKNSFGGLGEHFGTSRKSGGAALGRRSTILEKIRAINIRLDKVVIENKSFEEIIEYYDAANNFFYCDPPYFHGHTYKNSKKFNHRNLRDLLAGIQGRFLLSYDNCVEIKELYRDFNIIEITRTKGINRMTGDSDYHELIISNYKLENQQIQLELYKKGGQ